MSGRIQVGESLRGSVSGDDRRRLERALRRAAGSLGLNVERVNVRLVGEEEMAALRRDHLGEEGATDVLSFPDPDHAGGDVALCWEVARRQAVASGLAPGAAAEEGVRLVVHALAHLVGHDHGVRHEARRMLRLERRLLRRLGVPDMPRPYDERGGAP